MDGAIVWNRVEKCTGVCDPGGAGTGIAACLEEKNTTLVVDPNCPRGDVGWFVSFFLKKRNFFVQ